MLRTPHMRTRKRGRITFTVHNPCHPSKKARAQQAHRNSYTAFSSRVHYKSMAYAACGTGPCRLSSGPCHLCAADAASTHDRTQNTQTRPRYWHSRSSTHDRLRHPHHSKGRSLAHVRTRRQWQWVAKRASCAHTVDVCVHANISRPSHQHLVCSASSLQPHGHRAPLLTRSVASSERSDCWQSRDWKTCRQTRMPPRDACAQWW